MDTFKAFSKAEFVEHWRYSGFPLSKICEQMVEFSKESSVDKDYHSKQNRKFLDMQIPFKCLLESNPTYMPLVGLSFFTVEREFGSLEDPSRNNDTRVVEGCTHTQITRTDKKDSVLYEAVIDLI